MLSWKPFSLPASERTVLIIKDDKNDSHLGEKLFQKRGFKTMQATHENALQACKTSDPDLIVIDTQLSHVKRMEFCAHLRDASPAPILLLVADFNSSQMIDIYNIGVSECLLKPLSPAFLVLKATSWLYRRRWAGYDLEPPQYA